MNVAGFYKRQKKTSGTEEYKAFLTVRVSHVNVNSMKKNLISGLNCKLLNV